LRKPKISRLCQFHLNLWNSGVWICYFLNRFWSHSKSLGRTVTKSTQLLSMVWTSLLKLSRKDSARIWFFLNQWVPWVIWFVLFLFVMDKLTWGEGLRKPVNLSVLWCLDFDTSAFLKVSSLTVSSLPFFFSFSPCRFLFWSHFFW